jgi:hypothetical protein
MLGRATRAEVAKERRDLGLAILIACCTSFEKIWACKREK